MPQTTIPDAPHGWQQACQLVLHYTCGASQLEESYRNHTQTPRLRRTQRFPPLLRRVLLPRLVPDAHGESKIPTTGSCHAPVHPSRQSDAGSSRSWWMGKVALSDLRVQEQPHRSDRLFLLGPREEPSNLSNWSLT